MAGIPGRHFGQSDRLELDGCRSPEDVEGIVAKWRACLATGEVFEYETPVRSANGEYRWMFHHRKVPLCERQHRHPARSTRLTPPEIHQSPRAPGHALADARNYAVLRISSKNHSGKGRKFEKLPKDLETFV